MVAVMLSIVPGLGHIYKGYRLIGLLLIFFGTPVAFGLALLIATATAGFGFFLLPIYWIAVMVNVWAIPDRVVTAPEDEGEQVPESSLSLSSCGRVRRYINTAFFTIAGARLRSRPAMPRPALRRAKRLQRFVNLLENFLQPVAKVPLRVMLAELADVTDPPDVVADRGCPRRIPRTISGR